jgi:group I intron endonuclease
MSMKKTRIELQREFIEKPKTFGVFQIKNIVNGKVLLGSSLNLHGPLNSHRFMLRIGSHLNKSLQEDWNEYGENNFIFEILEEVKVSNDPNDNIKEELALLEEHWLEKIQPFGERGYNTNKQIRQA